MKLENQVTSLELSKKLKELGVKQESLFYWQPLWQPGDKAQLMYVIWPGSKIEKRPDIEQTMIPCSAFTGGEIGEILPAYIKHNNEDLFLYIWKDDSNAWRCDYAKWGEKKFGYMIDKEPTEPDARAKMLIYLIENNLVKV